MEIGSRRYGEVVVAAPAGRIDHANAEALKAALQPLVDGDAPLLVDLSGVDYISSVGLRVLMLAAKSLRARGRALAVAAAQPVVGEILQISRFDMILDVSPTLREGLQRISPDAAAAYGAQPSPGPR
jgi:anti-anti-sigma factor